MKNKQNYSAEELLAIWERIGLGNTWIKRAYDPFFDQSMLFYCDTLDVLKDCLQFDNWCLGQGHYYKNLCFINQVASGDEWLTIKDDYAFESVSFSGIIKRGDFEIFINRLLTATKDQCINLIY